MMALQYARGEHDPIARTEDGFFRGPKAYINLISDTILLRTNNDSYSRFINRLIKHRELGLDLTALKKIAIPAIWFEDLGSPPGLALHLVENLPNIEEIMVMFGLFEGRSYRRLRTIADKLCYPMSTKGHRLEAAEIPSWEEIAKSLCGTITMIVFRLSIARMKNLAVEESSYESPGLYKTGNFSMPEIWVGDHRYCDGKKRSDFKQRVEDLVTPEMRKQFAWPKIRIMGLVVDGVPYEGW